MTDLPPKPPARDARPTLMAVGLVGELGFMIALPIVVFGFGGAVADKQLGTTPLLMLLGFVLSMGVSAAAVWRLIKRLERAADPSSPRR